MDVGSDGMIHATGILVQLETIGVVAAFALARLLSNFLFGTRVSDIPTFLATPILLVAVALIAVFVPASRATRINPTQALRQD